MSEQASNEIVEALWESSLEQMHDDECGESETTGWHAIFRFSQDEWDNGVKGVGVSPFVGAIITQGSDGQRSGALFAEKHELERAWYLRTVECDAGRTPDVKTGESADKGVIKLVVVLTLVGETDDAYDVVDNVLDNGTFQDAIAEFAGDNDHDVSVDDATLVPGDADNAIAKVRALLSVEGAPANLSGDDELVAAIERMKFVDDNTLSADYDSRYRENQHAMIERFLECYGDTAQDTVTFGPEFYVVVRNILAGKRPTKLVYLTDFEGEEKTS